MTSNYRILPPEIGEGDRVAMAASAGVCIALIARSFHRLAGFPLAEPTGAGMERDLWEAPRAIVAHGCQEDPRFFYANRQAPHLFATPAGDFIGLPSKLSAEPGLREQRAAMLAQLQREDMIDGYSGVRIAATGRRFRIERAHVWNLADSEGGRHGQAAAFADWTFL